jgi:hypothetical protein
MASIRKRGDSYEARVRRKGYPTVVKHFRTKAEAQKFESVIESEMSRAVYVDRSEAERTTLRDALARDLAEVVPGFAGRAQTGDGMLPAHGCAQGDPAPAGAAGYARGEPAPPDLGCFKPGPAAADDTGGA